MHRALMAHSDPDQAGRWRQEPVWIGTSATSPVDVEYVAPRYERVPGLIEDLRGKGLTRNVTVPISAGLLVDVRA